MKNFSVSTVATISGRMRLLVYIVESKNRDSALGYAMNKWRERFNTISFDAYVVLEIDPETNG